jgi:hypothetical protein
VTLCILRVFAGLTTKNFQIQSREGFFIHFQEDFMAKGKKGSSLADSLVLWGIITLVVLGMVSSKNKEDKQDQPAVASTSTK